MGVPDAGGYRDRPGRRSRAPRGSGPAHRAPDIPIVVSRPAPKTTPRTSCRRAMPMCAPCSRQSPAGWHPYLPAQIANPARGNVRGNVGPRERVRRRAHGRRPSCRSGCLGRRRFAGGARCVGRRWPVPVPVGNGAVPSRRRGGGRVRMGERGFSGISRLGADVHGQAVKMRSRSRQQGPGRRRENAARAWGLRRLAAANARNSGRGGERPLLGGPGGI